MQVVGDSPSSWMSSKKGRTNAYRSVKMLSEKQNNTDEWLIVKFWNVTSSPMLTISFTMVTIGPQKPNGPTWSNNSEAFYLTIYSAHWRLMVNESEHDYHLKKQKNLMWMKPFRFAATLEKIPKPRTFVEWKFHHISTNDTYYHSSSTGNRFANRTLSITLHFVESLARMTRMIWIFCTL